MIVRLYRKYIPCAFREKIYRLFLKQLLQKYRYFCTWAAGNFVYLFSPFFPKNEYYDAYRFLGKHGITAYPFESSLKYRDMPVEVLHDHPADLPYVMHHGKRLYYPRKATGANISKSYRALLTEQDPESAHCYLASCEELKGKVLLDIGAAEGIFALDAVEFAEKIYLFEYKDVWMEPLRNTFAPWKEKTEIVKKYVAGHDDGLCITLDSFMEGKEQNSIHIKMDIEGAEQLALKGAGMLLKNGQVQSFSICTYHRKDDAKAISSFFGSLGYSCEFTKGYFMFFPHLRKAVCRGSYTPQK